MAIYLDRYMQQIIIVSQALCAWTYQDQAMAGQKMGGVVSPLSNAKKLLQGMGGFSRHFAPVMIAGSLGNVLHSWHLRLLQTWRYHNTDRLPLHSWDFSSSFESGYSFKNLPLIRAWIYVRNGASNKIDGEKTWCSRVLNYHPNAYIFKVCWHKQRDQSILNLIHDFDFSVPAIAITVAAVVGISFTGHGQEWNLFKSDGKWGLLDLQMQLTPKNWNPRKIIRVTKVLWYVGSSCFAKIN